MGRFKELFAEVLPNGPHMAKLQEAVYAAGLSKPAPRGQFGSRPVTPRQIAAPLFGRLVSNSPTEIMKLGAAAAALRCSRPFARPGEDPLATIADVPPEWTHVGALPPGHGPVDFLEALVADLIAGNALFGEAAITHGELTYSWPLNLVDLRADVVAERMGLTLPTARYGKPVTWHEDPIERANAGLADAAELEGDPYSTSRTLPLIAVAALVDRLMEHNAHAA